MPRISSLHKMSSWRENKTSVSGAKGSALRTRGLWCHSGHASRRRATCPPSGAAQVGSSAWKAHPPQRAQSTGGPPSAHNEAAPPSRGFGAQTAFTREHAVPQHQSALGHVCPFHLSGKRSRAPHTAFSFSVLKVFRAVLGLQQNFTEGTEFSCISCPHLTASSTINIPDENVCYNR